METTPDVPVDPTVHSTLPADVERHLAVFVNFYLIGRPDGPWVLVDSGPPGFAWQVRRAAEARFGGSRPTAIVLTHGHFDHAGNVVDLAQGWDVPVWAHRLEMPYLTGRSDYPPRDPTVGGALGLMSRAFPTSGVDLGDRVRTLPADGTIPDLPGWRWLHTPGHTAGHVSLYREEDGMLLAGDALATVNQDSAVAMATQKPEISVPPAPFTTDWGAARESVSRLARLRPRTIAAGHGRPISDPAAAEALERFAREMQPPRQGRYVRRPARADETGILEVPPPVPDPLPRQLLGAGVAAVLGYALGRKIDRRIERRRRKR